MWGKCCWHCGVHIVGIMLRSPLAGDVDTFWRFEELDWFSYNLETWKQDQGKGKCQRQGKDRSPSGSTPWGEQCLPGRGFRGGCRSRVHGRCWVYCHHNVWRGEWFLSGTPEGLCCCSFACVCVCGIVVCLHNAYMYVYKYTHTHICACVHTCVWRTVLMLDIIFDNYLLWD